MPVMDQSVHLPWGYQWFRRHGRARHTSPWMSAIVVDPMSHRRKMIVDDDVAFTDEGRRLIGHFLRTGEVLVPCDEFAT